MGINIKNGKLLIFWRKKMFFFFLLLDAYSSGQSVKVKPGMIDRILNQLFFLKGKSHLDCTSFCNVEPGPIGQPSVVSTLLSKRLCHVYMFLWFHTFLWTVMFNDTFTSHDNLCYSCRVVTTSEHCNVYALNNPYAENDHIDLLRQS